MIEAWFDTLPQPHRELARRVRQAVLEADPVLDQSIKWGNLVFSLNRRHALAIVVYRQHVDLQVFNGVQLQERHPALTGSGRTVRQLRLRPGDVPDPPELRRLAADALALMRAAG